MWRRSVLLLTSAALLVGFSSTFLNKKGEPWAALAPSESALAAGAPTNAAMCPVDSDTGQVYFVSCGGIY